MSAQIRLRIELRSERFDPAALLAQWQEELTVPCEQASATTAAAESVFIGRMRPAAADGVVLTALELEHYPGMTERQLDRLALECCTRHGATSCLVLHRIGRVLPGEAIVMVATGADRRGPAQRSCQELVEALKHDAPFWKREWRSDGRGEWLNGNTPL